MLVWRVFSVSSVVIGALLDAGGRVLDPLGMLSSLRTEHLSAHPSAHTLPFARSARVGRLEDRLVTLGLSCEGYENCTQALQQWAETLWTHNERAVQSWEHSLIT